MKNPTRSVAESVSQSAIKELDILLIKPENRKILLPRDKTHQYQHPLSQGQKLPSNPTFHFITESVTHVYSEFLNKETRAFHTKQLRSVLKNLMSRE